MAKPPGKIKRGIQKLTGMRLTERDMRRMDRARSHNPEGSAAVSIGPRARFIGARKTKTREAEHSEREPGRYVVTGETKIADSSRRRTVSEKTRFYDKEGKLKKQRRGEEKNYR